MPTLEDVQKSIQATQADIDTRLKAVEAAVSDGSDDNPTLKSELKAAVAQWKESNEELAKLQKQADEIESTFKRYGESGRLVEAKSWGDDFAERLKSDEGFQAYRKGESSRAKMAVAGLAAQKAVHTTGTSLTGEVIAPTRVPGVVAAPNRPVHIRQFIAEGQTSSNSIRYVEETGFTNNAAMVAEGTDKPESNITLAVKDAPVRLIAHLARVSRQMLDDIPFLASYLGARLRYGLRLTEDAQILYGDGTGENLKGLTTYAASAFDKALLHTAGYVEMINRIDVIRFAILQARRAEYAVDVVMLSPLDCAIIESLKDSQGRYLDELDRLGVTVVENTAVNDGDFVLGSFSSGGVVMLFDRMETEVEFFEQDRDNVPKNLITVRAEERLALPVFRPEGIVYGTFADALTPPA